jgi:2'-5' RNA ligase
MYRLFVAIDPPEETIQRLREICLGLPGAKWNEADQIHLTLRFIGEVDGGVLRDIQEALAAVSAEPFEVTPKGVGFFPPRKNPESLWVGIENPEPLIHLRNNIESALVRAGVKNESRRFYPHIALARLKNTPPSRVARFLSGNSLFRLPAFPVTEFCLYSSFLSSERALHQVESVYPLTRKRSKKSEKLS